MAADGDGAGLGGDAVDHAGAGRAAAVGHRPVACGADVGMDVDTRADVYGLGVLLYELLTGVLPLEREESSDIDGFRVRVRTQDPLRPSARLARWEHCADRAARTRSITPRSLVRQLSGDLDWITMMALEKDRTRRYETAAHLAEDLRRHLQHRPVAASPPSAGYRLRKLVRRYRVPIAAGAAILLALTLGLVIALRALDAESRALAAFRRMQDVPLADDLLEEADADLWPAQPRMVEAMDRWLERARRPGMARRR